MLSLYLIAGTIGLGDLGIEYIDLYNQDNWYSTNFG